MFFDVIIIHHSMHKVKPFCEKNSLLLHFYSVAMKIRYVFVHIAQAKARYLFF